MSEQISSNVVKPDASKQPSKLRSNWRDFLSTFGLFSVALFVSLFLVTFVFRSYQVSGQSMETTLQNNDSMLIWKVPRSIARITGNDYIPNRGDIIVFNQLNLSACGQTGSKQLIKRVIGLPGERVAVNNGTYTIYNHEHPNGFNPDTSLPYGKDIPETSGDMDVTLGSTQLFVSGDNRPNSCDSRAFGPIDASQIVGKLVARVLPIGNAESF